MEVGIATCANHVGHMLELTSRVRGKRLGFWRMSECGTEKKMCHSLFDPLWQGKPKARKKRKDLYAWLAGQMGIPVNECHFGYFNLTQLLQAYKILQSIKDLPMRYDNCGNCFFKEADHDTGRTTTAIQDFWDEAFHYSKHEISDTSKAIALECM